MIPGFPDVQKAPSDVIDVTLDWTPFLPAGTTSLASHSVSTQNGDVVATDTGVSGIEQTVRLTGGTLDNYTQILARVTLADGKDLTRGFNCLVR